MVSESTQQGQTDFVFRKLDKVRVKGKNQGIEIYEVLGRTSQISPEFEAELKEYHKGLDAYFSKKWEESYAIMDALHEQHLDATIYRLYRERIQQFKEHPVPADWDGVFIHTSK